MKRLGELLAGLRYDLLAGTENISITSIATDSRAVTPGALFVCVRGTSRDGHQYLAAARDAGAVVALVTAPGVSPAGWQAVVRVADERVALGRIAAAFYDHPERDLAIVGITGTNGKTTTTHLLESIEAARGRRTGVVGTIAYRIGDASEPAPNTTPDTLTLMRFLRTAADAGAATVAIEVSSHALEQRRITGVPLDVAVFTNLTRDHLDYHRDMEEYFAAKKNIFALLRQPVAAQVINLDDAYGQRLFAELSGDVRGFAVEPVGNSPAVVAARGIELGAKTTKCILRLAGEDHPVVLPLAGRFNVFNALGAAAAAAALGASAAEIIDGLQRAPQVNGRFERLPLHLPFSILVDYAHTPDALEKVIAAVREVTPGRLLTVFGCGGDRDRSKRPLMGEIAGRGSDLAIVTSDNPRTEEPGAIIDEIMAGMDERMPRLIEPDRHKAIALAIREAREGDTVLIAGKGHETYQIIGSQRHHFNDAQVATEEARKWRG